MKYKSVIAPQYGPAEVLEIIERELRAPAPGEARVKILAASVSRPDITVRTGTALYTGTPLAQKLPVVPGYSVVGVVDAVGAGVTGVKVGDRVGALTVVGGYTEYLYWCADRLFPVPAALDPVEAVTLILNYLVAYQVLHRSAQVQVGDTVLIIGASGGIGTALAQLGKLAQLKMYGLASSGKQAAVAALGVTPIDYHAQDFVQIIREREPLGLNAVFDGMTRLDYIQRGLSLLRRGGKIVSYGEPASLRELARILRTLVTVKVRPNGKTFSLYGTSTYFLFDRRPYLQDWATLFKLLAAGQIKPIIAARFPLLEAAQANKLLESGQVTGNVVLSVSAEG